jgi:hypothetical protein
MFLEASLMIIVSWSRLQRCRAYVAYMGTMVLRTWFSIPCKCVSNIFIQMKSVSLNAVFMSGPFCLENHHGFVTVLCLDVQARVLSRNFWTINVHFWTSYSAVWKPSLTICRLFDFLFDRNEIMALTWILGRPNRRSNGISSACDYPWLDIAPQSIASSSRPLSPPSCSESAYSKGKRSRSHKGGCSVWGPATKNIGLGAKNYLYQHFRSGPRGSPFTCVARISRHVHA